MIPDQKQKSLRWLWPSGIELIYLICSVLLLLAVAVVISGCSGNPDSSGVPEKSGESNSDSVEQSRAPERGEGGTVGDMSLRDAVGQMFVVGMSGTEPDYYIEKMVRERNIGGVLLFGYNMESEAQTKALVGSLQRISIDTEPGIPLFVAVDQEGGEVSSAPWVSPQPAAARIGSLGDPAKARAVAEQIGHELGRAGVNTDFAPVVDTGFGAAIGTRSYGQDPKLVSSMGAAAVEGFDEAGVVSSAKHFPNHGPAQIDSHVGRPRVNHDMQTMMRFDLPPFIAAIEAGVPMIMVGHLIYPAVDPSRPASLSPEAFRLLREEVGFDGVAVTDDLSMEGAKRGGTSARAAVDAVKAGADLLIISGVPQEQADAYNAVVVAVESGEIPRERVDEAVERILAVKERYGIYRGAAG